MNILLLESDLSRWGGSEAMAFAIAEGFFVKGHPVFLVFQTDGSLLSKHRAVFKDVLKVGLQPFGWRFLIPSLCTAGALGRLARKWNIDVIFTSHRGFLRTLALVATLWRIPFVYHLGLGPPDKRGSNTWAIRQMAAGVSPSNRNGKKWITAGLPAERLHIVPNWIDFQRFAPAASKPALRCHLRLSSDGPMIVFVGRVVPEKGVEMLLRVFSRTCKLHPSAVLVMVGEVSSSYAEKIVELCGQLGLSEKQVFQIGRSVTPEKYFAAADIAVVPSLVEESFGLAAVEAMASGALTLVSSAGELATVIGPDNQDLVFSTGDERRLAEMLDYWIRCPEEAKQRGLRLREFALTSFQSEDKINRYENIIKAAL